MSETTTLIPAHERLSTALADVAAAEQHLVDSRAALAAAQQAETVATRALNNPQATDDPAALIATQKAADETLRHALLVATVSDKRLQAAREAHKSAHHDTMRADHNAAVEARMEAARKRDGAMAAMADAEAANAVATERLTRLYARGFPRKFDGALLEYHQDVHVTVRSEKAEQAVWAGVVS